MVSLKIDSLNLNLSLNYEVDFKMVCATNLMQYLLERETPSSPRVALCMGFCLVTVCASVLWLLIFLGLHKYHNT